MTETAPAVFISYSHDSPEHDARVLALADRLRADGVNAILDQYIPSPPEGWPKWMDRQMGDGRFVLVVCTGTYYRRVMGTETPGRGLGVRWESTLAYQHLYDAGGENTRFIPLLLEGGDPAHIPTPLKGATYYFPETPAGYEGLYRHITGQPAAPAGPIGPLKKLPPLSRHVPSHPERSEAEPKGLPIVSLIHLPETGPDLFGREEELALLDAAWASGKTHVVTIVAAGGTGKTALVKHWLARMAADGWRGATRVLGWSFYSQGAREDGGASADPFIDFGLRWFGDDDPTKGSPWEKGERLAGYFAATRSLLVLDGMEPLQYPPGAEHAGRVRDPALGALLTTLAFGNVGLCVATTREPVSDVAECIGQTVVEKDLRRLPRNAAIAYLRRLGVTGKDDELAEAAAAFDGHALALTLLGGLLADYYGGDARRWREVGPLEEDAEKGGHAKRVMAAYERWLGEGPERVILRMIGLFDRPASAGALDALTKSPPIPGLTDQLFAADGKPLAGRAWERAVARLRKARLLELQDPAAPGTLDAHPLVREHFGATLQADSPAAYREGHLRLYDFYCKRAPDRPDTLDEMQPLYAAMGHGCKAGRRQDALDAVYWRRIRRGNEGYSWGKLGAFTSDLAALSNLFDQLWNIPAHEFHEVDRAFLLNETALILRALGRASEAEVPMRAGLSMYISQENWKAAAISAANVSELALARGKITDAIVFAQQAVAYADKCGQWRKRMRCTLADALAQAGNTPAARSLFEEAEEIQAAAVWAPTLLYGLGGYRYCDLLLSDGKSHEVLNRALQMFRWREPSDPLLDSALDHLSLGRAHTALGGYAAAVHELNKAVNELRAAGTQEFLPCGLLARVTLRRGMEEYVAARKDLDEATRIAIRSGYRLHEADTRLEWARLHLAEGDRDAARAALDLPRRSSPKPATTGATARWRRWNARWMKRETRSVKRETRSVKRET